MWAKKVQFGLIVKNSTTDPLLYLYVYVYICEHAQGPKTPRPIRDQDYHHVIG